MTKKFVKYATSTGKLFYFTSHFIANNFLNKLLKNETAIFQGEEIRLKESLNFLQNGVYCR
jgi:hypothetical protein